MDVKFDDQIDLLMEQTIDDALEQYRNTHPGYDEQCRMEDSLFETLTPFFSGGHSEQACLYYDILHEYFKLMGNKPRTELKIAYMRGYMDCLRLARKFGWLNMGEGTWNENAGPA